jgi:hypothetical protein
VPASRQVRNRGSQPKQVPAVWEAPGFEILKISATANSTGYNADYKGPHLNLGPETISPPPVQAPAKSSHTLPASTLDLCGRQDLGGWQAPRVTSWCIATTASGQ